MATVRPQPVAGVSTGYENLLETVYPSISSRPTGRFLGRLYDSIPLKINGVKLSYLLFTLPTSPIGLLLYFLLKLTGEKYVLTNQSLERRTSLSNVLLERVELGEIAEIECEQRPGQAFFRAGDLYVLDSAGDVLTTLSGVPRPERFRHVILEARDALLQTQAALSAIQSRHAG